MTVKFWSGQAKQKHEAAIYWVRKTVGEGGVDICLQGEPFKLSSVLYKDFTTKRSAPKFWIQNSNPQPPLQLGCRRGLNLIQMDWPQPVWLGCCWLLHFCSSGQQWPELNAPRIPLLHRSFCTLSLYKLLHAWAKRPLPAILRLPCWDAPDVVKTRPVMSHITPPSSVSEVSKEEEWGRAQSAPTAHKQGSSLAAQCMWKGILSFLSPPTTKIWPPTREWDLLISEMLTSGKGHTGGKQRREVMFLYEAQNAGKNPQRCKYPDYWDISNLIGNVEAAE